MTYEEKRAAALEAAADVMSGLVRSGRYVGTDASLATLSMAEEFTAYLDSGRVPVR